MRGWKVREHALDRGILTAAIIRVQRRGGGDSRGAAILGRRQEVIRGSPGATGPSSPGPGTELGP